MATHGHVLADLDIAVIIDKLNLKAMAIQVGAAASK